MNYLETLQRAIIYIEEHLKENITVEAVAHETGYSYYHLTRQFQAVLGENIGSYIKGRRLSEAARQLLYSDQRIIAIAMEYGFESGEAFSRAFKSVYRMSPSVYRKNRLDLIISNKEQLGPELIRHRAGSITVHPRFVELPDLKVAGLRGQTTLRDNVVPQLWAQFMAVRDQIPHPREGGLGLGICEASSENISLLTMNDDVLFSEVAGIEVDSYEGLADSFVAKTVKGGRYAVFTHKGSLAMLRKTFDYIWGTWAFNTKTVLDDREDFEGYDERFLGYDHPDSEIDIYIPVK